MLTTIAVKNRAPNWPAMCEVRVRDKLDESKRTQMGRIKNTSSSIWFEKNSSDSVDNWGPNKMQLMSGPKGGSDGNKKEPNGSNIDSKTKTENKWKQKHLFASKKTQLVRQCPQCQLLFGAFHACKV